MDLKIASAKYVLGLLHGEELPNIAIEALKHYPSSEMLLEIAGENKPTLRDIAEPFEAALAELALPLPSIKEALFILAQDYAKQIISGEMPAYQGAHLIWWQITNQLEHPTKLMLLFVGCASEIEDLPGRYGKVTKEVQKVISHYESQIIKCANELLTLTSPDDMIKK